VHLFTGKNIFRLLFILCIAGSFYGFLIEPYLVVVRHVFIKDAAFSRVLSSRTVLQISDLHIRDIGIRERKLLRLLKELQPDIIFLTGDYVPWKGDYRPAFEFFSKIEAKIGVWAVMGDYDYSASRQSCMFCHEEGSSRQTGKHRVHFLKNHAVSVNLPESEIWIAGVDNEIGSGFSRENINRLVNHPGTVLISHEPTVFDAIDDNCSVLVLAGDTHGGQLPLPEWLWKRLGYKQYKYMRGWFQQGKKKMYVTTGIGTSTLPIRLLRPPEIVVLHFL